jgi:methylated-DNA-protein-cysteine methyltransferase-like protein
MTKSKSGAKAKAAGSGWTPIYDFVKRIPRGRVLTYGEVARRLGFRNGARMIGYAMAATPRGSGVPWHRVMGAGGRILLAEPLDALQRKLLESEGVEVLEKRVEIEKYFWKKPRPARKARPATRHKASSSRRTH